MKKYLDIFLINVIALILGIIIYYYFDKRFEILTAILATGISISFGIRQYKIQNDKMFKQLFSEFNDRYDTKFNETLNNIEKESTEKDDYELSKQEEKVIIDYLNLCAEEYLWYKKRRIDESVWRSWENGIVYYLNISPINIIIVKEEPQKDSYYGLFDRCKQQLTM